MRSFVHVIADPLGLHARSCVMVAREASKWDSEIVVRRGGCDADAKTMSSLLKMKGAQGDELTVCCEGVDEAEAAAALEALMRMSL